LTVRSFVRAVGVMRAAAMCAWGMGVMDRGSGRPCGDGADRLSPLLLWRAPVADGNGVLDRAEFKACLMSADLGLTRKEINLLLTEADDNGDGVVEYDEFVPLCFKILVEKFKEDYLRAKALQEAGELESLMLNEFVARGLGENGKMPRAKVKKVMGAVLNELVPVTKMQVCTLCAVGCDGMMNGGSSGLTPVT
jgi:hypothetical protein